MNLLMTGMILTMHWLRPHLADAGSPGGLAFWFVMSMALLVGFVVAYPINWWLVVRGLKHGMITVRPSQPSPMNQPHTASAPALPRETIVVAMLSIISLALTIGLTG